jgi:fumarylacetoacetase
MSGVGESRSRKSWVDSANEAELGFPLQNLPFCAFQVRGGGQHLGVGIGDSILDLAMVARSEAMSGVAVDVREASMEPTLNRLMALGQTKTLELRSALMRMLTEDAPAETVERLRPLLSPMGGAQFCVPVKIGDYTDFYASIHHATNVGKLFRPDQPLMPNYKFVPIGYHGRASSIVISGSAVTRPNGQTRPASADVPTFGPSRQMDYELELGVYPGIGNSLAIPVDIDEAEQHVFGVSLLNDWSARDIQAWEYQPLGPFLGKSFATSVSPWVVTMDALAPFRVPLAARGEGDPNPLPYLSAKNEDHGIDIQLEVYLTTSKMREESRKPVRVSRVSAKELYWSFAQMVAHHTSNGCNLRTGDLLASGTISGREPGTWGSLLEITRRGEEPLKLPSGEERGFLEDGDEVTFRGFCERDGLPRIGLGECKGMIIPATLSTRGAV